MFALRSHDIGREWCRSLHFCREPSAFVAANLTIDEFAKSESLKALDKFREKMYEAQDFALDLMEKTLQNAERNTELIAPKLQNWEVDRITLMDMILMRMALTEILEFLTIPVKVTINEYIDISKNYSTPKSKDFINDVLDKVMKELQEERKDLQDRTGVVE